MSYRRKLHYIWKQQQLSVRVKWQVESNVIKTFYKCSKCSGFWFWKWFNSCILFTARIRWSTHGCSHKNNKIRKISHFYFISRRWKSPAWWKSKFRFASTPMHEFCCGLRVFRHMRFLIQRERNNIEFDEIRSKFCLPYLGMRIDVTVHINLQSRKKNPKLESSV